MKNLRLTPVLIPTEGASLLTIINCTKELILTDVRLVPKTPTLNQHLYLCSTLPIKEGDKVLVDKLANTEIAAVKRIENAGRYPIILTFSSGSEYGVGKESILGKISSTTDPKLISDGVPAIDGNTEAVMIVPCYSSDILTSIPKDVNFLSEFVKRWNQKDNQKDGYDDWMKMAENNQKGVDVEKLADDYMEEIGPNAEWKGFVDGYNQALQSNAGGFSLGDIKKCFFDAFDCAKVESENNDVFEMFQDFIQSLSKEQPKEDIVIECEMENKHVFSHHSQDLVKIPVYKDNLKIKLKDGQPILIFK